MRKVKLSDVCDISSGGTPSRKNHEYFNGDIPWAKISDIENADSGVVYTTEEHISTEGLKNIRGKLFPKGTLLFAMYGSIGKVGITGRALATNQAILGIRPRRNDEINLSYLKSWFENNKQKLINQGRGVALKNLSATIVRDLEIELPHLDDQKRIAHLLGKVEGLIAQRKQHLEQLDGLLKSVFMEMFGDPVRNEKMHKISTLGPFIRHLTSGGRGWAEYYSPSGKRFIRSLDVQMNRIGSEAPAFVNPPQNRETERTRVKSGDVLLTITGSKIGRACYVPEAFEEAYISQHVAIIRTEEINPIYLSFYLSMPTCGQRIIKKQQYGQAKPGINLTQISNFEILEPDISLQNQFAAIVEKVESIKSRYQQSLADLEALYGTLSQKAFKGELDLSQVPLV